MWRTRDGHILRLRGARLRAIARQIPESGLRQLVRSHYRGNLTRAVHDSIRRLARSAHRVGQIRHRPTDRRFPVFRAGSFRLITCPAENEINDILLIRPALNQELAELEVQRKGGAAVNWSKLVPLRQLPTRLRQQGGVYIIEKARGGRWAPVYVGQTKNYQRRMTTHRARFGPNSRVRLGTIAAATPEQRRTVEHALIRLLLGEGGKRALPPGQRPLENISSIQPYKVRRGNQVRILSTNTPSYLNRFFRQLAGGSLRRQLVRGHGLYEFVLPLTDVVPTRGGVRT